MRPELVAWKIEVKKSEKLRTSAGRHIRTCDISSRHARASSWCFAPVLSNLER